MLAAVYANALIGKSTMGILRETSRKGDRHHNVMAIIYVRHGISIDLTQLLDVGSQNECRV